MIGEVEGFNVYTPKCVICECRVRWQEYVCQSCEKDYPRPHPEWLRFLVNDDKAERMRIERNRVVEVPYSGLFEYDNRCGLPSYQGHAAVCAELEAMGIDDQYWECCDF